MPVTTGGSPSGPTRHHALGIVQNDVLGVGPGDRREATVAVALAEDLEQVRVHQVGDNDLIPPLHRELVQIHEQVLAAGTLPRSMEQHRLPGLEDPA